RVRFFGSWSVLRGLFVVDGGRVDAGRWTAEAAQSDRDSFPFIFGGPRPAVTPLPPVTHLDDETTSKNISTARPPTKEGMGRFPPAGVWSGFDGRQLARHLDLAEEGQHVALLDALDALEADAALEAGLHRLHVVLLALERDDPRLAHLDAAAVQARLELAL